MSATCVHAAAAARAVAMAVGMAKQAASGRACEP